jgi:ABC-type multidrug transport system ATPase subunit
MSRLHVDSVLMSFGNAQILTDIFLTCNKGEIVGLLGRNGSGKSTLLKIIFGSVDANLKFVKVGDKQIFGLTDNFNLIKYLPQENFLPNHIRISTIINLFCKKEAAKKIAQNQLISPHLNKKSKQLSGGEKRILEIFLIVYSDADFILIDEPFNGIAPVYKDEIKSIIKEQSQSKGFIITDHDYRNIVDVATKLITIKDGGTRVVKDIKDLETLGYLNSNLKNS